MKELALVFVGAVIGAGLCACAAQRMVGDLAAARAEQQIADVRMIERAATQRALRDGDRLRANPTVEACARAARRASR